MISEEFLRELGLGEEIIAAVLAKEQEEENKRRFDEIIRNAVESLNPYDTETVLKLFDTEGLEYVDGEVVGLDEKLLEFKDNFPFLFDKTEIPQLVSSTNSKKSITSEEFKKMGYKERAELYRKNPKLYNDLVNA